MKTYRTIKINGVEYEMGIEMIDNRNYAIVTLEEGEFREDYTWHYLFETLADLLEEIKEELK